MKRPTRAEAAAVVGTGARQGELFATEPWPAGFAYREEVISPVEERELAERFALLPLTPFAFRGFLARRRVVSFGWRYDYAGRSLRPSDEIPSLLMPLRERAAEFAGVRRKACNKSWSPNMRRARRSAGIATSPCSGMSSRCRSWRRARFGCAAGTRKTGTAARSSCCRARPICCAGPRGATGNTALLPWVSFAFQ